jgi:hypothetical protein
MDNTELGDKVYSSKNEIIAGFKIVKCLRECPIPDDEMLANIGLFLTSKNLSRIFFMEHIYKQIIETPGVVMDMGTRFGNNVSLFLTFRSMYEPFHRHRKIIGFDTFEGFPEITNEDGNSDLMKKGNLKVGEGYYDYLNELIGNRELNEPLSHIKKYDLIKGDAIEKLKEYLKNNPHTIIALIYFDFDLYKPTKECLEIIRPFVTKGSVLAFDELNDHDSPGETLALKEVFGLNNIRLKRLSHVARASYFIVE